MDHEIDRCGVIIHLTDLHLFADRGRSFLGVDTDLIWRCVLRDLEQVVARIGVDLLVLTGDLAQDHAAGTYERIAEDLRHIPGRKLWVPGNHDDPSLGSEVLCGSGVFSTDRSCLLAGWNVVLLNTHVPNSVSGRLGPDELNFLASNLKTHMQHPTIICMHHPMVEVQSLWLDNVGLEDAEQLRDLIVRFPNVKAVLSGHVHQDRMAYDRSVVHITSPSTAVQFRPDSGSFQLDNLMPGFRVIRVYNDAHFVTYVHRIVHQARFVPDLSSKGY